MDDQDDTLFPKLGQTGAQARAGLQMLEALEALNQQLAVPPPSGASAAIH